MFQLRGYQQEAVDKIDLYIQSDVESVGGIVVAPTGSGKSLLIANTALIAKRSFKGNVVVIQPSKELVEQNVSKLLTYEPEFDVKILLGGTKDKTLSDGVTFTTLMSLKNLPVTSLRSISVLIIDEAHFKISNTYSKLLPLICPERVIGFTATPFRQESFGGAIFPFTATISLLDKFYGGKHFDRVLHVTQIGDLVQQGYLTPIKYRKELVTSREVLDSAFSCFKDKSIEAYHRDAQVIAKTKHLIENLPFKKVIIYCPTIDFGKALEQQGIARMLDSGMSMKSRTEVLDAFKAGEFKVIANVGILTTGIDIADLDCVVIATPIGSLQKYYQIIGRLTRLHDGKAHGTVIDIIGVTSSMPDVMRIHFHYNTVSIIGTASGKVVTGIFNLLMGKLSTSEYRDLKSSASTFNPSATFPIAPYKGVSIRNMGETKFKKMFYYFLLHYTTDKFQGLKVMNALIRNWKTVHSSIKTSKFTTWGI